VLFYSGFWGRFPHTCLKSGEGIFKCVAFRYGNVVIVENLDTAHCLSAFGITIPSSHQSLVLSLGISINEESRFSEGDNVFELGNQKGGGTEWKSLVGSS